MVKQKPKQNTREIVGTWLHAHEEDTGTEAVYRPGDYDFPPARGRRGYEFRADYTCSSIGISARDGSTRTSCTWKMTKGAEPEITLTYSDGREEVVRLVSVDADRLVLRKG